MVRVCTRHAHLRINYGVTRGLCSVVSRRYVLTVLDEDHAVLEYSQSCRLLTKTPRILLDILQPVRLLYSSLLFA